MRDWTTEAENLLRDLVAVPSLSYHEADAAGLLVDWMLRHGYDSAFVDDMGNAVGVIGSGTRDVVLLGHIDTFPGELPVRQAGRLLYGRGTVDAKGPLCAFAAAAPRTALPPDLRLIVIGAVAEEADSRGARYVAAQYQPAACLIGEPSRWDRVTLGYKGRLLLDYQWQGPLAHSAAQASTPAEHAVAYWQRVLDYANIFNVSRDTVFEQLDATLQALNTSQNGAYGQAAMTVGFRLPSGMSPAQLAAELQTDHGACISAHCMETAYTGDRNSAISRALRGAIRGAGGAPRFVYKTGTADMNVVGPIWNCPIAAYGPGDSALDHTPEEHIDLDEYLRAIAVLTAALERLQV